MDKKNTMLLTVIAVATLLVAVVGATFAYFTATNTNDGKTTTVTGTTESIAAVTLSNPTPELHIDLKAFDMSYENRESDYFATDDDEKNYDADAVQRNIAVATLADGGSAGVKYQCTTTIKVTATGTMVEGLAEGDAYVQFGGLLTDRVDLTDIKAAGYSVTFNLVGGSVQSQMVTAAVGIDNRDADQNSIANKALEVKFVNEGFDCLIVK